MQCDFVWVNRQIRAAKLWSLRRQLEVASRILGLSALLIFSFLTVIESLIRRGLIYHFSTSALLDLSILIAMALAYQWRGVLGSGLIKLIPGTLGERLAGLCDSHWGLFFFIPVLLFLVLLLLGRQLGYWSSHFQFTKHIAAEVFRYQLESAIDKTDTREFISAPEAYRNAFALTGVASPEQLATPAFEGLAEISVFLNHWAQGNSQLHSLAIVGHKGCGKTCLLDYLQQNSPAEHIVRASVPAKLTRRRQVLAFFGEILNVSLTENTCTLLESDSVRSGTLLLIDDAHNLFLASPGEFEGYETLLELISQPLRNVCWCLAFNHHSWTYLNSVCARHQYFATLIPIPPDPNKRFRS